MRLKSCRKLTVLEAMIKGAHCRVGSHPAMATCFASAGNGETPHPSYTTTRQESHHGKPRKNYTPVEKVAILRRHLIDRVPVSDLCDEYQLSPTLFYIWQKQFFENGASAFERKNGASEGHLQRTIAGLRDKLQRKNEVVAELMEDHIKLKKELGEL
jgi:transposase-like protein